MTKKRVVVLMGGASSEHDVSIASGRKAVESLTSTKYDVVPVTITRDGLWMFSDKEPVRIHQAIVCLDELTVDCVFLALHGAFGEDGRIQGMLDLLGLPYTSSGCAASALAIDKLRSKALARDIGVRVAKEVTVASAEWENNSSAIIARIQSEFGLPCVVKSPRQGSSFGLEIPHTAAELEPAIETVFSFEKELMIEEYIAGTEVTCGVLDVESVGNPVALPVTEIRPVASPYFDYHAKYTPGASEEITPAEIPPDITQRVQEMAVGMHNAVGCSIWSRSDFLIDASGPVWIEINTIPGMTPTSLYPQAAAAAGIPYEKLVDMFVEAAMARQKVSGKE